MKTLLFLFLLLPSLAFSDTFVISWDNVTQGIDNSPVQELQGYKVYISKTQGSISPTVLTTVNKVTYVETKAGTYYVVVTAYNPYGESDRSVEVSFKVTGVKPKAPTNIRRSRL